METYSSLFLSSGYNEISIKIKDVYCPWNEGVYSFTKKHCESKVISVEFSKEHEEVCEFDLECDIVDFVYLLSGKRTIIQLRELGKISFKNGFENFCKIFFPKRINFLGDRF